MKQLRWAIRLVPIVAVLALATGCVASSKYEAAVSERDSVQQQLSQQTELREKREAELAEANAAKTAVEQARAEVTTQLESVTKEREKLSSDLKEVQTNLSTTKADLTALTKVKEDTQKSLVAALGELDTTKRDRDTAQVSLKSTKDELDIAKADRDEARTNYEVTKAKLSDVQGELAKQQKLLADTQATALAYSKEVDQARTYVDVASAMIELDMAETEAENFSAFMELDAAVKATGDQTLVQPWSSFNNALVAKDEGAAATAYVSMVTALQERLAISWP